VSDEKRYLVLTAVGPDRPGLVREISRAIRTAGGNLENSRMAILGGEFAIIVLVSGAAAALERLEQTTGELQGKLGLRVLSKPTGLSDSQRPFVLYRIRVTGVDHPGIVERVSEILAGHGINVASLETHVAFAPLSGTPLFVLEAELQIPSETALARLRRELSVACEDENLDLLFEPGG
jgi:glycine cleavage system transcriptional repressor